MAAPHDLAPSAAPLDADTDAERARRAALADLDVLDSAPDDEFEALVNAAALVCRVPISLLSLIDDDRQWFKANVGLAGVGETPREQAFCDHAIRGDALLEVADAQSDPRFAANPLVTGEPSIRFYAGATLRLSNGARVGTLCVIDREPRTLDATQRQILEHLAAAAVRALERRRDARARAESEARFRALSEAAPLGVFATDAHGALSYTNPRWREIFGLDGDASLGDGWLARLHPDDREAAQARWHQAALSRAAGECEFRVQRHDGSERHLRSVWQPVAGADGAAAGHVGSVEDVTERVQAEQDLRRLAAELSIADRHKNEFLATLAHELRNPLAPLHNGLQVLRRAGADAVVAARMQDMMERQLTQLTRLVDDLLDVARIGSGKVELRRVVADLREIVASAVEASQPLIDSRGHALGVELGDAPLPLEADAGRLVQVVGNLLGNAAKYTPSGGRIELSARRDGAELLLTVRDSGIGIAAADLASVFDMFNQVEAHAERAQGGLGIGLSLVRRLVELHGGSVAVASAGAGLGATFTVRLPALGADAAPAAEQASDVPA